MTIEEAFGVTLKKMRQEKGLSQEALAECVNDLVSLP